MEDLRIRAGRFLTRLFLCLGIFSVFAIGGYGGVARAATAVNTFSSTNAISIGNSAIEASPYSTSIDVSGLTGLVTKVRVTLTGLSHENGLTSLFFSSVQGDRTFCS